MRYTGDRQEDPRTTAAGIRRPLDVIHAHQSASKVLLLANPQLTRPDGMLSKDMMPDALRLSETGDDIVARGIEPILEQPLKQPRPNELTHVVEPVSADLRRRRGRGVGPDRRRRLH